MSGANRRFVERYGAWGVVAGASEGLGAAYARALAQRGLHVVLVARRAEPLKALADELQARYAVRTLVLGLDLAQPERIADLQVEINGLDVGLLVWNAAQSVIGPFAGQPLELHLRELEVNCRSPLTVVHRAAQSMMARGRGGIILMSSLSGMQGTALVAHYAATKAWNRVLAEGLWWELGKHGVDVLACVAGATDTPGYRASAPRGGAAGVPVMSPEAVVEEALAALGSHPSIVAGRRNRWAAAFLGRLLGRRAAVRLMGRTMDRLYGNGD